MLEKEIEDLVSKHPDDFFPNEGFVLVGKQITYQGRRFDLLFEDKHKRKIIIEVKRGVLTREASGQIVEYYGLLKANNSNANIEMVLLANNIPNERRVFLENVGISCKEISEKQIFNIAEKYNESISNLNNEKYKKDQLIDNKKSTEENAGRIKTIQDFYDRIQNPEGRNIIDIILRSFLASGKYVGLVEQKKFFYSYAIYRKMEPKISYDYAFIVNRNSLLFYIRKPGEKWLLQNGRIKGIESNMIIVRKNNLNEITIRIINAETAKKLCDLILDIDVE